MIMTNNAIKRSLLESLHAYVRHFEIPNSRDDLLSIASSILTFQQKQRSLAITSDVFESLIQQVVDQFNAEAVINSVVTSTTETLIREANKWRQSLGNQVLNTLNAYVQKFQPKGQLDLTETILSIIPLVESVLLGKSQAESLIQQVKSKFDLQAALGQVIGAEPLAIAQKLANLLQFGNLEELLKEAILGDQPLLNKTLETVTESLVNSELSKILGNNALKVDIDLDSQRFMVKQVTLKLNVIQSSPPPSKSAEEIARQLDVEVEIFKVKQKAQLGVIDLLQPKKIGELEVGIPKQEDVI
jgi:hypothetical protein